MKYVKGTVVVPNGVAVAIRKVSQMLERSETDGMFTTPLSATGNLPATHWISSGFMPIAYLRRLKDVDELYPALVQAYADEGAGPVPWTKLQVTNALGNCEYSPLEGPNAESVVDMLARLGLKQINGAA